MLPAAVTSTVITLALSTSPSPARLSLLPGHTASPWPRYLFLFRGVHGGMRLDELRAAAHALGVDGDRLCLAPATIEAEAGTQPDVASFGGDVGPDLFQWVAMPDAQTAAQVAARCSTVRGAYEVWASAAWPPADAVAPDDADASADVRWNAVADAVQAAEDNAESARRTMLAPLGTESWRCDVLSVGRSKPRDLRGKVELMEKLDALLSPLPGAVELRSPTHVVAMIEDCREPEPEGGWDGWQEARPAGDGADSDGDGDERGDERGERAKRAKPAWIADDSCGRPPWVQAPHHLFLGRQLSRGASHRLARFSLSDRRYLGRTTLPPDLAYLMAVQAHVLPGSLVLDPFCGTASILMSCASLGAATVGVEVDERVLHGEAEGDGGRPGILANFEQVGLPAPEALVLGDMGQLERLLPATPGARLERFDAIVTDPPYGLMEGLGRYYLPLGQRLTALLRLASRRLRLGGRLVFLLPVPADADAAEALPAQLPTSRCLAIERISRQRLSMRMHRLLCTMVKVAEPATPEEGLETDGDAAGDAEADAASRPHEWSTGEARPWEDWWRTVDAIEEANAGEASRVW